jgi:hypothetical protein
VQDGSVKYTRGKDNGKGSQSGSVLDRIRKQLVSSVSTSNSAADSDAVTLRASLTYINIHFAFVAR